jgi:hypothetical protein
MMTYINKLIIDNFFHLYMWFCYIYYSYLIHLYDLKMAV